MTFGSRRVERVKVKEAAKLLGVSDQFIRCGLRQKALPFGSAVKVGNGRYTYHIVDKAVHEYLRTNKERP